MAEQLWLQLDDELLLDGVDYRVVRLVVGRTDRLTFQCVTVVPQLGGETRMLLQLENGFMEAAKAPPETLTGEQVELDGREFSLRWDSGVQTERTAIGGAPKFGRGRCAWYAADDGEVAVLIVERYDRNAFVAEPLADSRVDLRFTEGLREGRE